MWGDFQPRSWWHRRVYRWQVSLSYDFSQKQYWSCVNMFWEILCFFFLTCSNLRSFFHVAHGIVWIRCSVSIPLLILGYIVFNGQQYTYRNGTGTGTVHSVSHATWMIIRICVSHDSCEGQCLNLLFSFSATFFWLSNPHFSIICHHFPSFAIIFPLRSWL